MFFTIFTAGQYHSEEVENGELQDSAEVDLGNTEQFCWNERMISKKRRKKSRSKEKYQI